MRKPYKLAKLGTDSSAFRSLTPERFGHQKRRNPERRLGNMVVVPSYVKDGQIKTANNTAMAGVNKFLKWKGASDRRAPPRVTPSFLRSERRSIPRRSILIAKIQVTLAIIECDSCNSVQDRSSCKAQLVFQFPKDYLSGADGGQISDVINQILEINTDEGGDQQQGQDAQGQHQQGQQGQQQQAAAQPPPTIQVRTIARRSKGPPGSAGKSRESRCNRNLRLQGFKGHFHQRQSRGRAIRVFEPKTEAENDKRSSRRTSDSSQGKSVYQEL